MKKNILSRMLVTALLAAVATTQSACGLIVLNDGKDTTPAAAPDTDAPTTTDVPLTDTTAPTVNIIPPTPADEARVRLSELPDRDFGGAAVIVATVDSVTICPDESDDPVIMARVTAKNAVEEKYNTTIITTAETTDSLLQTVREAHNSDMFCADLISIPQSMVGTFYSEGLIANLYSLPHVDYDAEYFNAAVTSAAVAGNGLYAVFGAASFNPDYLSCVYFNKTLAAEYTDEDLYTLVREGKWTWDKLAELSKEAASSEGVFGHGSSYDMEGYIDIAAASQGLRYTSNAVGTVPTVNYLDTADASPVKSIVDKLHSLLYTDNSYTNAGGTELMGQFIGNSLLFMTEGLYAMDWISDVGINWGILPLPKYDEAQKTYISPLADEAPVFCVIDGTRSYENSGIILEALNAASHDHVLDEYINKRTDYNLRDSDSIDMLETICAGASSDFSHMYASGISNLENATYGAVHRAVTTRSSIDSLYRSYKSSANRSLTSRIKLYG